MTGRRRARRPWPRRAPAAGADSAARFCASLIARYRGAPRAAQRRPGSPALALVWLRPVRAAAGGAAFPPAAAGTAVAPAAPPVSSWQERLREITTVIERVRRWVEIRESVAAARASAPPAAPAAVTVQGLRPGLLWRPLLGPPLAQPVVGAPARVSSARGIRPHASLSPARGALPPPVAPPEAIGPPPWARARAFPGPTRALVRAPGADAPLPVARALSRAEILPPPAPLAPVALRPATRAAAAAIAGTTAAAASPVRLHTVGPAMVAAPAAVVDRRAPSRARPVGRREPPPGARSLVRRPPPLALDPRGLAPSARRAHALAPAPSPAGVPAPSARGALRAAPALAHASADQARFPVAPRLPVAALATGEAPVAPMPTLVARRAPAATPASTARPSVEALAYLRRQERTVDVREIQETVTRRLQETLERRVSERVESTVARELAPDSTLARRLGQSLYAGLHDQLVLERERLGWG